MNDAVNEHDRDANETDVTLDDSRECASREPRSRVGWGGYSIGVQSSVDDGRSPNSALMHRLSPRQGGYSLVCTHGEHAILR